jgi:putative DNA primase/helicase
MFSVPIPSYTDKPLANVPAEPAYWSARADELARWAWERLVVRVDVAGRYYVKWDGDAWRTETYTWPPVRQRGKVFLTPAMLERHFRARAARDVIGLHAIGTDQLCLAGQLDLDNHGNDPATAAVNWRAALGWFNALTGRGLRPLLTKSSEAGSFHLRTFFSRRQPAAAVFRWLRELVRDYRDYGLSYLPECFPKQPALSPPGQSGEYGSWLRLVGRHPKRDFWAQVWDGEHWLSANRAIDYLLSLDGDAIDLGPVPAAPPVPFVINPDPPPDPAALAAARIFLEGIGAAPGPDATREKVHAYLATLPAGMGVGQGRDDIGFKLACVLARDNLMTDAEALPLMREWDQKNAVPKGEQKLVSLLQNARKYGGRKPARQHRGPIVVRFQL